MIVCPQPVAAEAGIDVLRAGGNAVDAAVAVALVQGVIDPMSCGLGGSGVLLLHLEAERRQEVVEFHARAGRRVRPDQWQHLFSHETASRYGYVVDGRVNDCGYQSVAVPGAVAGLSEALRRYGTISWRDAIGPGLAVARRGMVMTGHVHGYLTADKGADVVRPLERISWTPESRRIYTKFGALHGLGDTIANPDLARTYERLAEAGPEDFYTGEIAAAIVADFAANGGCIDAVDLSGYRSRVGPPLWGKYRGLSVAGAPPPAGGMTLVQMLNYLEGFDLRKAGWPSAEAARFRVEAMRWAMADRESHLADPLFADVPVGELTAKEYAAAARAAHDSPSTTHVCIIDAAGNAVSLTHTLGASSGVVTPGLGFLWNNYLNCFDPRPGRVNSLAPGKTRITMMAPTMVMAGGRPELVLGAPGGTRIVNGLLQTISNLVDHGMTPLEAVVAPRVDFQGDTVEAEQRIPAEMLDALIRCGLAVHRRPLGYDPYFSEVQVISVGRDGALVGACDPRGDGGIPLSS